MPTEAAIQIEKIALFLGRPWKVCRLGEPSDWRYDIIDGTGRNLSFRVDKDKFKITGCFPRDRCEAHRSDYTSIGVSIARPAQDIAADIKRRLLPQYLERYPQTVARFQENKAKEQHLDLMTQALHRIAGGRVSQHGRGVRSLYFKNGEAEIWRDGYIDLNLRKLTIEQAIKVISVIQNI